MEWAIAIVQSRTDAGQKNHGIVDVPCSIPLVWDHDIGAPSRVTIHAEQKRPGSGGIPQPFILVAGSVSSAQGEFNSKVDLFLEYDQIYNSSLLPFPPPPSS